MDIWDTRDKPDNEPNLPPMPYTTKRRGKRTKHTFGPKQKQRTNTSIPSQIYREGTDCIIADEATEKRLSRYGPATSTKLAGYNFLWGEVDKIPKTDNSPQTEPTT